jgi:hypothetical protein
MQPGPDGRIYMAQIGQNALHTINFPDQFNQQNQNECGFNPLSVPVTAALQGSLPNMAGCSGATLPAQFTTTVSNCLTVQCTTTNCAGTFNWNFGDALTGSGASVSHTYAAPGNYTITLTASSASPSVATRAVTLGLAPVSIAGSNTACTSPLNYSVIGPAGYTYQWFVSGGTPSFGAGNSVDIAWAATGGAVSLTATDPATGCQQVFTKNVGPCPVCKSPPLNMTAWWPLDEIAGSTGIETVLGNHVADIGGPAHVPGMVRRARNFDGATQHLEASDAPGLNFGTGDLTIDAWVRTASATGIHRIVDKRTGDPAQGWSLYLRDGRLALGLGAPPNASLIEYWLPTTPYVADGQWHHVAGVVDRADVTSGTRLFVDGVQAATWPAFGPAGNLTNTEKLRIGAGTGGSGPPADRFAGAIDEVELFQRALSGADLLGIAQADSLGKCKEFVYVPKVADVCRDGATVTVTMSVCNYSTTAQTYQMSLAGLPAGPGCSVAGPTVFAIAGPNPVTVPPNSCVAVPVTITRPPGMGLNSTACYTLAATNVSSNQVLHGQGSISISRRFCNVISVPFTKGGLGSAGMGSAAQLRFVATNTSGGPLALPYTITVEPAPGSEGDAGGGGLGDPPTVSLNGLPPGTPFTGVVNLANEASANLDVVASFGEPRAFRFYDVVLRMDEDGDGIPDAQTAQGLIYHEAGVPLAVPPTGAPRVPEGLELDVPHPNPAAGMAMVRFSVPRAESVTLALYDIAGRRVRTFFRGPAQAGPGAAQLDYTGVARGFYLLRLEGDDGAVAKRVTLIR